MADDVGQTDLALGGQTGGHNILGDVAGGVGAGAVDFAGVFAAEGAAADPGIAAIGIDDDFTAGQAGIGFGTGNVPQAGTVDNDIFISRQVRAIACLILATNAR